jgi:hypothetical protein
MGEGPWDQWTGTDSLLERLVAGGSARLEGSGNLTLEDEEDVQEANVPKGPGQVDFVLLCDFEEFRSPLSEAIQVRLVSRDDAAFEIVRGVRGEGLSPLPRYRLSGTVSVQRGELPVSISVTLDSRTLAPITLVAGEDSTEVKNITRVAIVDVATVGQFESAGKTTSCRAVLPNFAGEATVESGGARITVKEVSPESTSSLYAAESRGKLLPSAYLEVQRLHEDADEAVELALNDFGWLLSFYTGRRVHPFAWEGTAESDTVWHIQTTRVLTPFVTDGPRSCVSGTVSLEYFLGCAWKAWQELDERYRARLRGAVNLYTEMLSATFPTQRLALTTMYLESFRDLVLGSSTVLEAVNKDQKKFDPTKIAKAIRNTLRNEIKGSERLSPEEELALVELVKKLGPGQVNNLFRKTFKESLLELYKRAQLEVDPVEIGRFITERDKVMHGSWDSGREGTLNTYRLAEYGLNLLEKLLLRLLGYEGKYHNRVNVSTEDFPAGKFNWQSHQGI